MADRFRIYIIDIGSRDYGINIVILNDNIMKMKRTFITAFFAMLLVVFSVSCSSEEKEFDYAALPMSAQQFVKQYFAGVLFDDRTISILAYNLETVLAEKLETVLSRNIANTRPRDYYDVHILYALRGAECDKATLRRALERTTQKRGSGMILTNYPEIMKEIRGSDTLRKLWEKYSREYEYAKDISFDDTCNTIQTIMDAIMV